MSLPLRALALCLVLVGCVQEPDEGIAVGNPGKADFEIGAGAGLVFDSVELDLASLLMQPCDGGEVVTVAIGRAVDGEGGDTVDVPEGRWCAATLEFGGDLRILGPEVDAALAVEKIHFDMPDALEVAGDTLQFLLGEDGWMTPGLVVGAPVEPGDPRHDLLVARLRVGSRIEVPGRPGPPAGVNSPEAPPGYVAVGAAGRRLFSDDGLAWVETATGGAPLRGLTHAEGIWVAVGGETAPRVAVSTDGETWHEPPLPMSDEYLEAVTWGSGRYVAVGIHGLRLVSDDAWVWTPADPEFIAVQSGVAWGNDRYVAVGRWDIDLPDAATIASTDGVEWSGVETPFSTDYAYDVAFGNNRFVLVGTDGLRATSGDGASWQGGPDFTQKLRGITYGRGIFAAVGWQNAWTSVDGDSWAPAQPVPQAWDVTAGIPNWVAVGEDGWIYASSDGSDWAASEAVAGELFAVAFAGAIGLAGP